MEIRRLNGRPPQERATDDGFTVDTMTDADIPAVYALRTRIVQESSPAPKQFDRWGPGVAVFVPPPEADISPAPAELTPPEPSQAMHQALRTVIETPDAGCLVARVKGEPVGFTLFSVLPHPAMPGSVGVIDMLVIDEEHRSDARVVRGLVSATLAAMRRLGTHVFKVEYERGSRYDRNLWAALGWRERSVSYFFD